MNRIFVLILGLAFALCSACATQEPVDKPPSVNQTQSTSETPPTLIDIEGDRMDGNPDAELVVVEFADYQCPACGRQARNILPKFKADYIDTGKVAYVYKDFPIEQFHLLAFQASEAAQCAGDQGKFWEMHNLLFSRQDALQEDDLYGHAESLSLDISAFQDCMITNKHAAGIRHNIEEGKSLKFTGTPTIYICTRDNNNANLVQVVQVIRGVGGYGGFSQKLEKHLQ